MKSNRITRALRSLLGRLGARFGLVAAGSTWLFVDRGVFAGPFVASRHVPAFGLLALVVVALCAPFARRVGARQAADLGGLTRFELGLGALALLFAAIQATGGPTSPAKPLLYFCVAMLAGFNVRLVGGLLVAGAIAFWYAVYHAAFAFGGSGLSRFIVEAGVIALFGAANSLFLQAEIARRRLAHQRRLDAEIRAMRDEARDFRLVSSSSRERSPRSRQEEEGMLAQGAVDAIHQTVYFVLDMLKQSMRLHTCVLLWIDARETRLRVKELVTESNAIVEGAIPAHAGVLGGIVKNHLLLNLHNVRHPRAIPYYAAAEPVGAFLGAPVLENGFLRGVLCADREQDRPFTVAEEGLFVEATRQVLRAVQTERVFSAVERSKYEHERFYHASSMLNGALTLSEVYDTAFAAAREIVEFDFGAITLVDRKQNKHVICRVVGEDAGRFEGEAFGQNAGLVSMVVKNRHFLPAGDGVRDGATMVFTRKLRLKDTDSLCVLPLILKDEAIGTFVLAAKRAGVFGKECREMLGVICNQVAVSVENAKMYKQMEEMATTDGLTGLPNHRTFQTRCSEMLQRAERHQKPIAIILTDIDKFKSVNDTYGHPVGDAVLKRVSKVLAAQVRKVDVVARYGGEEFVMVLEETDGAGAKLLCERVRQEVAAQVMSSDKGSFRVTISLGIAAYPRDGNEKAQLIERADQALYSAKESGRNRTVCYADLAKGSSRNKQTDLGVEAPGYRGAATK